MKVTAVVTGLVDQEGDPQHNPFVAYDATQEKNEIGQGCPGKENTDQKHPEPGRERRDARRCTPPTKTPRIRPDKLGWRC